MFDMAAFDFFKRQCNELDRFIQPLKIHGIHYFSFARIYNDGKVVFFCNHLDWLAIKTENNLYDFSGFVPEDVAEEIAKNYNSHIYTGESYKGNRVLSSLFDTNRWNSLDLYRKKSQYLDIMHLGSTKDNVRIVNFYLNSQKMLQSYFENFLNQFEDVIQSALQKKYYIEAIDKSQKNEIIPSGLFLPMHEATQKNRIQQISSYQQITLNINNTKIRLSQRESSCMYLMAQGKSYKEIATILSLSPRTIECYINNIKTKTDLHYKTDLINLFHTNFENIL